VKYRFLRITVQWTLLVLLFCLHGMPLLAQSPPNHPDVAPSEFITVENDELKLAAAKPNAWSSGTPLPSLLTADPRNGIGGVTEEGALDPDSLVLTHDHKILVEGKDYLIDPKWGTLGIAPGSSVTINDQVTARYRYFLLRLDSIVRGADGKEYVKQGKSAVTTPHPPDLAAGEVRIANIYVPYRCDGRSANTQVLAVLEDSKDASTHTVAGRIPRTLAKLQSGQAVKIVCWGDSITAGGDASTPQDRYPAIFESRLRAKYPNADIVVKAVAAGGSTSREWLYPEKFLYGWGSTKLDFNDVLKEKPDLVTIEFANDAYIDAPQTLPDIYNDILNRLTAAGAEVIVITPSFFNLEYMKFHSDQDQDARQYDFFVRKFANEHQLGIADVSSRWEHLFKEGIPYTTYLKNSINHPDNRGHLMFVDELMKNFL
jgi:lysophospholipase L1-like esterase